LAFLVRRPQYSRLSKKHRLKRLYQWLSEQASFFRYDAVGHRTSSTVRTETTVRREGMTLLVSSAAARLDICPLCGNTLAPTQAEQARLRLLEGSISQETGPVDSQSP
jgi:hypothetical protein